MATDPRCWRCDALLIRRLSESNGSWRARRFCNHSCSQAYQEQGFVQLVPWPEGCSFEDAEVPDERVCRYDRPSNFERLRNAAGSYMPLLTLVLMVLAGAASAAPPGANPVWKPWFESLHNGHGSPCCGGPPGGDFHVTSRVVSPENSGDDHWHVFLSQSDFGGKAPDKMVQVPNEIVRQVDNGMPRPVNAVVCAHDFGAALVLLCFVPPLPET
jgi:hypothetical protein